MSGAEETAAWVRAARGDPRDVEVEHALAEARRALLGEDDKVALDRYVLLHRLGRGGAGVVFAAFDPALERKVAIKLIDAASAGIGLATEERLLREAKALAMLSHPNVIPIFDVGTYDQDALGRFSSRRHGSDLSAAPGRGVFIVMELVEGRTLARWFAEGSHPWPEVVRCLVAAGRGLAAAHRRDLVHRDFKPANVLLDDDPHGIGRVRVADFGLVRASVPEPTGASEESGNTGEVDPEPAADDLTAAGAVLGTPAYMAPEQHDGRPTDARTDQFGFCVALFEGLFGQRPYAGVGVNELADAKRRGPPAPPLGHDVPPPIVRAVLRGLAPDPHDRFPHMDELLARLEENLARRRRFGLTAVGVLAAGGIGAASMVLLTPAADPCADVGDRVSVAWRAASDDAASAFKASAAVYAVDAWERVDARMNEYGEHWGEARVAACRAGQAGEATALRERCLELHAREFETLADLFTGADDALVRRASAAAAGLASPAECADIDALDLAPPPPADPQSRERAATAADRLAQAAAMRLAGRLDDSLRLTGESETLAREAEYEPAIAEALEGRATMLAEVGKYDEAADVFWQAVLAARRGRHTQVEGETLSSLAFVVGQHLRDVDRARTLVELAEATLPSATDPVRLEMELRFSEAHVALVAGDQPAAIAALQRTLDLAEERLGTDHPEVATILSALGMAYRQAGEHAKAREVLERAVAIDAQELGAAHPSTVSAKINLANALVNAGKLPDAIAAYAETLPVLEQALGPTHPHTAVALGNYGEVLHEAGRDDEAEEVLKRAIAAHGDRERPGPGRALRVLATVLHATDRDAEAEQSLLRAVEAFETAGGPDEPELVQTLLALGRLVDEAGRPADARAYFERAVAIARASLAPENAKRKEAEAALTDAIGSAVERVDERALGVRSAASVAGGRQAGR